VGTAAPAACRHIEGTTDASTRGSAQFVGYGINALWSECLGSGSFGQLRGTIGGEIRTDMFNITSSTFKL
jgi:hypothetical protein